MSPSATYVPTQVWTRDRRRCYGHITEHEIMEQCRRDVRASGQEPIYAPEYRLPCQAIGADAHYIPDGVLPNGICIEVKSGGIDSRTRRKMEAVIAQHTGLDLRIVFHRSAQKSDQFRGAHAWALKNGIKIALGGVLKSWIEEPPRSLAMSLLRRYGGVYIPFEEDVYR